VVPDKQTQPWPEALRLGSGVYGWALLQDVPLWYELWRQLNGFPANYPQTENSKQTKDKSETKNSNADETEV
jgi:hypothetical protein